MIYIYNMIIFIIILIILTTYLSSIYTNSNINLYYLVHKYINLKIEHIISDFILHNYNS